MVCLHDPIVNYAVSEYALRCHAGQKPPAHRLCAVQDVTSPDLEKAAGEESLSIYCGFDPTAESLHLGNMLGILVLSWFSR